jgi:hypothetical protein
MPFPCSQTGFSRFSFKSEVAWNASVTTSERFTFEARLAFGRGLVHVLRVLSDESRAISLLDEMMSGTLLILQKGCIEVFDAEKSSELMLVLADEIRLLSGLVFAFAETEWRDDVMDSDAPTTTDGQISTLQAHAVSILFKGWPSVLHVTSKCSGSQVSGFEGL